MGVTEFFSERWEGLSDWGRGVAMGALALVLLAIIYYVALKLMPHRGAAHHHKGAREGFTDGVDHARDWFDGEFEQRRAPGRTAADDEPSAFTHAELPAEDADERDAARHFSRGAALAGLEDREASAVSPSHLDDLTEGHVRLQMYTSGRLAGSASRHLAVDADLQTSDPHAQAELENRMRSDARTTRGSSHTNYAHVAHAGGPSYGAFTPGHVNVPNTAFAYKTHFKMLQGDEAF